MSHHYVRGHKEESIDSTYAKRNEVDDYKILACIDFSVLKENILRTESSCAMINLMF